MFLLNQTYQERCGRAILSSGREINKFKYSTPKVIPMDTNKATPLQIRHFLSTLNSAPCLRDGIVPCLSTSIPICTFRFYFTSPLDIALSLYWLSTDTHVHFKLESSTTHPLLSISPFLIVLTAQMHQLNFNQLNSTHPNERSKFKTLLASRRAFWFFFPPYINKAQVFVSFYGQILPALSFDSLVISSMPTYSKDLHLTHLSDCPIKQLSLG